MSAMDALPDLLALYEEVASITGRMFNAAQQRDWDQLNRLEQRRAQCIKMLAGCANLPKMNRELRYQKITMLRHILDNDRKTHELSQPWTRSIEQWTTQIAGCLPRDSTDL